MTGEVAIMPTCKTCAYWGATGQADQGVELGMCRFEPPSMADDPKLLWPVCREDDWCGSWSLTFGGGGGGGDIPTDPIFQHVTVENGLDVWNSVTIHDSNLNIEGGEIVVAGGVSSEYGFQGPMLQLGGGTALGKIQIVDCTVAAPELAPGESFPENINADCSTPDFVAFMNTSGAPIGVTGYPENGYLYIVITNGTSDTLPAMSYGMQAFIISMV